MQTRRRNDLPGRRARRSRQGLALLYAVFAAFMAASVVSMMLTLSMVADKVSNVKRYGGQADYLAEGAVEAAKKQIQSSIANWSAVPATGTVAIYNRPVGYSITPTGFSSTTTDQAGIQTLVNGYEVTATASVQGNAAVSRRIINSEATPIFQYAVFYTNDLEILPGPNMTLSGRVHSNRDMYLGSNGTLTMNTNYVRAVGNMYRNRKDDPTTSPGTVNIRKWVSNPWDALEPVQYFTMKSQSQMSSAGVSTTSGFDSHFETGYDSNANGIYTDANDWLPWGPGALAYWSQPVSYTGGAGHTVMSAEQGVTEAVTPQVGSVAMYEPITSGTGGGYNWDASTGTYIAVAPGTGSHNKGYYHQHADLSIITKANGTWKAYNNAGTDITSSVTSAVSVLSNSLYDARQAGGATTKLRVTQINIGVLASTGKFPANGLLYAAHYGEGTGLNAKGVRLTNGSTLPSKLTVVSEDPIYVKGDYNTVAPKGAAVIGDAVNLLSNAWNDTKTRGTLPAATNTTYNCAMISGNQTSTVGGYNGGLENLPRFHENWSGRTATIKGSFVNTWKSQYATGAWLYGGDRYQAPTRVWSYDTAFNNVANLPPFTPMAVSARDVVSW